MGAETVGYMMGNFIGVLLISFVVTWILQKLIKSKNGLYIACLTAFILALGAATSDAARIESSAALFYIRGFAFAAVAQFISYSILKKK